MNDSLEIIRPSQVLSPASERLPPDIENHERKLRDTQASVAWFGKTLDARFLSGWVGIDPIIGLLPWVGDVVAGLLCVWLLIQAGRVKSKRRGTGTLRLRRLG
ncbi:MAG: DUF4112 domain-containing protein [Acetobacteraceae bacterium]